MSNKSGEPRHPTYGTIDELLDTIRDDITDGYELRIGLLGALSWFAREYSNLDDDDQ